MADTTIKGQVYNNSNQYSQASGQIPVGEVMGIEGLVSYNGQSLSYGQYIQKITQDIFLNNSYVNEYITRKLNTTEVQNNGTRQYTLTPALVPVSNFTESDIGNRNFSTAINVYGMLILYLQTNFWANNLINMTGGQFKAGIQERLIGTLQKSIPIAKNYLSLLEETMFCLATGQFFFTDLLGKNIQTNVNNNNNMYIKSNTFLWDAQQPMMMGSNGAQNIGGKEQLIEEFNSLSALMTRYPLSNKSLFAFGYNLDDITMYSSFVFRQNLSQAMNWGAPFDANVRMVDEKSFERSTFSNWYNIALTNRTTLPQLQNGVGMVQQAIQPSASGAGSPLGFGFNNVADFSYLNNVVGISSHKDSVETYITQWEDFNPYSTGSKNFYRLGGMFGWGQVHLPNYSGAEFALLDTSNYIKVLSKTTSKASNNNYVDWTITATSEASNGDPITTATMSVNGITTTIQAQFLYNQALTDIKQAQQVLMQWEPGMQYEIYNFPQFPTDIDDAMPGTNITTDGTTAMTFSVWLQNKSLHALQQSFIVNNVDKQLISLIDFGNNQGTYAPFDYSLTFPTNLPVLS